MRDLVCARYLRKSLRELLAQVPYANTLCMLDLLARALRELLAQGLAQVPCASPCASNFPLRELLARELAQGRRWDAGRRVRRGGAEVTVGWRRGLLVTRELVQSYSPIKKHRH